MSKPTKYRKQLTFDNLPPTTTKQNPKTEIENQKQICITQMETITRIDELILKVSFKLEPSWRAFSKIKANLFFENTQISSIFIKILQGPLATNELEYHWVIDTKGIAEGTYRLKMEMYEEWSSGERLYQTSHETIVKYVSQTRQSRLIKIPFVKKITRADVVVISDQEKQLYSDIEKAVKAKQKNQRDM
jgi:hypothetical protein